jgi:hypothetical protein
MELQHDSLPNHGYELAHIAERRFQALQLTSRRYRVYSFSSTPKHYTILQQDGSTLRISPLIGASIRFPYRPIKRRQRSKAPSHTLVKKTAYHCIINTTTKKNITTTTQTMRLMQVGPNTTLTCSQVCTALLCHYEHICPYMNTTYPMV